MGEGAGPKVAPGPDAPGLRGARPNGARDSRLWASLFHEACPPFGRSLRPAACPGRWSGGAAGERRASPPPGRARPPALRRRAHQSGRAFSLYPRAACPKRNLLSLATSPKTVLHTSMPTALTRVAPLARLTPKPPVTGFCPRWPLHPLPSWRQGLSSLRPDRITWDSRHAGVCSLPERGDTIRPQANVHVGRVERRSQGRSPEEMKLMRTHWALPEHRL